MAKTVKERIYEKLAAAGKFMAKIGAYSIPFGYMAAEQIDGQGAVQQEDKGMER